MANSEHLEVLQQGVKVWNKWREDNPDTYPDLLGADLISANLEGINFLRTKLINVQLNKANLAHADFSDAIMNSVVLRDANLEEAYLLNARLMEAHLERVSLHNAVLMGASFRGANLTDANLTKAKFWITNLAQAKLHNADFTNATMGYSFLEFLDLRSVKGLETVSFTGPLSIGVETLYLSNGQIPVLFLKNAGVPESLIDYLPSLVGTAIEFYTCFISFAEKDYEFAEKLRIDLQNAGVRCWLWKEDAKMGHDMWKSIDTAIRTYDKLIVVCSEHSLTSPAVLREVERALQKEDDLLRQGNDFEVLFPIRLDDYVINEWSHHRKADMTGKKIGDFRNWRNDADYRKELKRLLDSINKPSSK
jgi:uncharacterized protein YjbI with pentapeptide repeats